ncbi:MAG: zinc-dependent alcohol dehydrogenase family protein [Caldimonas sp.]
MRAMVARAAGMPLEPEDRPDPEPGPREVRIRVEACAVCRTDLHVVDGELPGTRFPIVPGHEIVGIVDRVGAEVRTLRLGDRVGVPWLGHTCGDCAWCQGHRENLCDAPVFTGHGRDGGFASHVVAEAAYAILLDSTLGAVRCAPLLCAGLIGFRALRMSGNPSALGLYGFGAAAHLVAQVALHEKRRVYAFTRVGDWEGQAFARSLGVTWAGGSDESPPEKLDAALIFAPVGDLVPIALRAVDKGGRVVCAGIHMTDIPKFPYRLLWEERQLLSVANLARTDASNFFRFVRHHPLEVQTTAYPLEQANQALDDLRNGRVRGAAVLVPERR